MAPYELMARDGSIHIEERSGQPSIERLKFLAETFTHGLAESDAGSVELHPDHFGHRPNLSHVRTVHRRPGKGGGAIDEKLNGKRSCGCRCECGKAGTI